MLEKEPKQGKKLQYLRIYNLEKNFVPNSPSVWSRIHLVPKIFGPEFTWSRIHLVPNSPDTVLIVYLKSHIPFTIASNSFCSEGLTSPFVPAIMMFLEISVHDVSVEEIRASQYFFSLRINLGLTFSLSYKHCKNQYRTEMESKWVILWEYLPPDTKTQIILSRRCYYS